MKLIELQEKIKEAFLTVGYINSVYFGSPYEYWVNGQVNYHSVVIELVNITTDNLSQNVSVRISCGDKLAEGEAKTWRVYDMSANAINIAITSILKSNSTMRVENSYQFTPFTQQFGDMVTGVYSDINFRLDKEVKKC